ncbi:MAG: biopolymer transporter ExbD [Elusimicrobiota bacterium]|jgi:biopolymer transport protein ExbD
MSSKNDAQRFADFDEDLMTGINVTPLVDVCLVLVIIFMVTTPLLSRPAFDVKLPIATTQEGEEKDKVTLSLGAGDKMAVDAQELKTIEEVRKALELKLQLVESRIVILRADKEATHGRLTELMAAAKDAGARSISIATEQKR